MELDKLKALFGVGGDPEYLSGGQGRSFRIGNLVFKKADDPVAYETLAGLLDGIEPTGYELPVHVRSVNGNYCESGYYATEFVPGSEPSGRLGEKLEVSTLYHRDMSVFDMDSIILEENRWEYANSVLWRGSKLPEHWTGTRMRLCRYILDNLDKVNDRYQIIHGDLGGNIIFRDNGLPVVIDFSPTIAPKKFADAIIVCDAIAWDGQPMDSLKLLKPYEDYEPYLKYAVAFRVLTMAFSENFNEADFTAEWEAYKPVWDEVCS